MNNLLPNFRQHPYIIFWATIFFTATSVSIIFQFIVLPYFLPWMHAGNGLISGYDWIGFHQDSVEIAKQIKHEGWSSWQLQPAPYGVVSAIYALTVSEPYMIIPLNAVLHATAGIILMYIARFLTNDDFTAMCAALPFVLFPSSMAWYTQIHKESFFIAGLFLSLYGWIVIARLETWKGRLFLPLLSICWIFFGSLLIWLVRPYGVKLMQGIGVIFAIVLLPLFLRRGIQRWLDLPQVLLAMLVILTLPIALGIFKGKVVDVDLPPPSAIESTAHQSSSPRLPKKKNMDPEVVSSDLTGVSGFAERANRYGDRIRWQPVNWLPGAIDDLFFTLSVTRIAYADSKGASNIDSDIILSSVSDFFVYLPRALQIGFLAPFPKIWIENGSTETNTLVRRIAGAEMTVVYLTLLFLPYALWLHRKKLETWMIFSFCTILLLIYSYTMPNIGTLYRTRYGFLMPLVGIGVIGGITAWKNFRNTLSISSK